MQIGRKIREIRKSRDMTLEELSQKSGVALATLSRMENEKMNGTLDSHKRICKALGTSLAELYQEVENRSKTLEKVKKATRIEHFTHNKNAKYELLVTKTAEKLVIPLMLKIAPGGTTQEEQNEIGTEKFIYLLNGSLKATVGEQDFPLKRGDSLYFDASLPHSFKNDSKAPVEALCVVAPSR